MRWCSTITCCLSPDHAPDRTGSPADRVHLRRNQRHRPPDASTVIAAPWPATAWTVRRTPCRGDGDAWPRQRNGQPAWFLIASNGLILAPEALREVQLRFPEQVALAGFDNLPWTRLVEPGITVIAQPVCDIGQAAIELLMQRISHPVNRSAALSCAANCWHQGSSMRRAA